MMTDINHKKAEELARKIVKDNCPKNGSFCETRNCDDCQAFVSRAYLDLLDRQRKIIKKLTEISSEWDFAGDIDGAIWQKTMIEIGILRAATKEEKRNCDPEFCACRDYYGTDENSDEWECWRLADPPESKENA